MRLLLSCAETAAFVRAAPPVGRASAADASDTPGPAAWVLQPGILPVTYAFRA